MLAHELQYIFIQTGIKIQRDQEHCIPITELGGHNRNFCVSFWYSVQFQSGSEFVKAPQGSWIIPELQASGLRGRRNSRIGL